MKPLMNDIFNTIFEELAKDEWSEDTNRARRIPLRVDLEQDSAFYVLTMDVPGLSREDISIKLDSQKNLIISAERTRTASLPEGSFRRQERAMGKMSRSLPLPDDTDVDSIMANVDNGVLKITLARKQDEQPEVIDIPIN